MFDKIYAFKYDMKNDVELEKSQGGVSFSITKNGEHDYSLIIGDDACKIDIKFEIKKTKGLLYAYIGAASMREYYENEENSQIESEHLFVKIGNNEIDLEEAVFPLELRICNSHVSYDPTDLGDLEFDLELLMYEKEGQYPERIKFFQFTIAGHKDKLEFVYSNKKYSDCI